MYYNDINDILVNMYKKILNTQSVSDEELKILLLIIYNELLINLESPNPITKSLLTLISKECIDLEDIQQQQRQEELLIKNQLIHFRTTKNEKNI